MIFVVKNMLIMKKASIFLFQFFVLYTYAQPAIEWQKSLGGSNLESAYSIQQTSDGGYIVCGTSESNDGDLTVNKGGRDGWVIKLNSLGDIQWQKSYGGSDIDNFDSVYQLTDGTYIISGTSYSNNGDLSGNHGSADMWILNLDANGDILWQKLYGGSEFDGAPSIQQTMDGGYIVAAYAYSTDGDVTQNLGNCDYWILKLNSTGNILWQKSYGGSDVEIPTSIQQTADGGYVVAGETFSNDGDIIGFKGESDYWVVKLDSNGNFEWQSTLGGSGIEYPDKIQQTDDGGFIVSGYAFSNDGDVVGNHGASDYWVVKLSSTGDIQWKKALGGSSNEYNGSIHQTSDGGYIVTSYSYSNDGDVFGNHGSTDAWVVRLNNSGVIQWQKSIGGTNSDAAWRIYQTSDGGYITAGFSDSNDGDVSGNNGSYDMWIVKLSNDILSVPDTNNIVSQIQHFFNPRTESIELNMSNLPQGNYNFNITNSAGQIILSNEKFISQLQEKVSFNMEKFVSGIYFVQIFGSKFQYKNKFLRK